MYPDHMLDTDTASLAVRGSVGVAETIQAKSPSQICISSITLAELRFGVERNLDRENLERSVEAFLTDVEVLDFDENVARVYGVVAARLKTAGTPTGAYDTLLAAHAMSAGATFVTNNEKHFRRVEGLVVENWH